MLLIEADGKALFAAAGIDVPPGRLITHRNKVGDLAGSGPWMVKAQVPVGGRGKAGGIKRCATAEDVRIAATEMLGSRLKGHTVEVCLVEQAVTGAERYLAMMIDPASYGVRVIYLAGGGMDVEQASDVSRLGRACPPDTEAITNALAELTAATSAAERAHIDAIGRKLAQLMISRELMLAEINPLFVDEKGCCAGDAKVVVDLNAIDRQPTLATMISARPQIYTDANRKLMAGFDYVELDPQGEIGLVTTGAGLSMMLIDELAAQGLKPLNFCDVRTGQLRGSPQRLIRVLQWITARETLRVVIVNIFAGITDLGEFAGLLADAVEQTSSLRVPVVARLVGRGAEEAKRILGERRPDILVTEDLQVAIERIRSVVGQHS